MWTVEYCIELVIIFFDGFQFIFLTSSWPLSIAIILRNAETVVKKRFLTTGKAFSQGFDHFQILTFVAFLILVGLLHYWNPLACFLTLFHYYKYITTVGLYIFAESSAKNFRGSRLYATSYPRTQDYT